jgi:hypothetical protein
MQTKLLHVTCENSMREYRVGDSAIIDNLEDCCAIYPRHGDDLRAVLGPWWCPVCGFDYQWASVCFEVIGPSNDTGVPVTIQSIESFVPTDPQTLDGVHYVGFDLAEFSEYRSGFSPAEIITRFEKLPIEQKIDQIIAGHGRWLREILSIIASERQK